MFSATLAHVVSAGVAVKLRPRAGGPARRLLVRLLASPRPIGVAVLGAIGGFAIVRPIAMKLL